VGVHLLLGVILVVGPAFFYSKPKADDLQVLDVIPANLIDAAFNSGVANAAPLPPAPVTLPPPPPPTPVVTRPHRRRRKWKRPSRSNRRTNCRREFGTSLKHPKPSTQNSKSARSSVGAHRAAKFSNDRQFTTAAGPGEPKRPFRN